MTRALSTTVAVLLVLLAAGVVNAALITALPEQLRAEAVVWIATIGIILAAAAVWWFAVARDRG
jgi:hypothetical protein